MKKNIFFFLAVIYLIPISAFSSESDVRQNIPLNKGWKFILADIEDAKDPDFDDSNWRTLNLPHDWSIEGPINPPPDGLGSGGFFTHGIAWYRKDFSFSDTTKKVVVEFDGVYMNSDVWINGQFLGRRPYGFIGFRYDITEYLYRDGSPNVLAVRVDDSAEPSVRWYAGSGIYRHVRLITTSYTHFRLDGGVYITTPEISQDKAEVNVDYIIDAHFFTDQEQEEWAKDVWGVKPIHRDIVLRSSVLASDGTILASTESKLTLQSMLPGQVATQQIPVINPLLWSDKTPNLYKLRSTLLLEGRTLDETVTTFGIRSLEFNQDHGLFVNGKSTKLKGVCLHQDAGSFGNAVLVATWIYRLGLLKEMGCNAIRPSHHPFEPEFYELCDQLGFYVFDEAFDEWTRDWPYNYTENTRGKAKFGYHLYFNQWGETDLKAMLQRDRNHPSVIMYSIGNEVPDQFNNDGWKIAKRLMDICHEEDPTRPATAACDQSYVSSRNGFMDVLDIAGYNYIDRLYGDSTYVPDRRRFPQRIFLGTETGSQLHYWLGVRDNDFVIGDFIWTGIDYLGETRRFPSRGNRSGFIDIAGGKKPGFFQRAAYWSEDPVLQISVLTEQDPDNRTRRLSSQTNWNWPKSSKLTVRTASNCDEVELFLNNRSLGKQKVSPDLYYLDWSVSYAPGAISAIGYNNSKKVIENKLVTSGEPVQLQIKPVFSEENNDISIYEILVYDESGIFVFEAEHRVTVQVEGAGKLIGLDSGNLVYEGLFKTDTRNLHQGRLLVTVQQTEKEGKIKITASASGLSDAVLTIN